jgi:hypothetical protein
MKGSPAALEILAGEDDGAACITDEIVENFPRSVLGQGIDSYAQNVP